MSQLVQLTFELFGPRKGQTVVVNGHHFVNGSYQLAQSSDNVGHIMKVLSFYGAYAKGTPEYEEALEKERAANGPSEVHAETKSGATVEVRGDIRQDGEELTSQETDAVSGTVETDSGDTGVSTAGNGHEDSRLPKFEETLDQQEPTEPPSSINESVKSAMLKLDPENDSHWVNTGAHKDKPRLSAVEEAYGRAGLTRSDLEAAIPGWDRTRASESVLEF